MISKLYIYIYTYIYIYIYIYPNTLKTKKSSKTPYTSAEVFEILKNLRGEFSVFEVFCVFGRFRKVFANGGKVFFVFAKKRNGVGGIFFETITFPYGNNPNLGLGCFRKET